jgi:phospholipid/cholesterol/gamma-HCH transport system substrate-binding protein
MLKALSNLSSVGVKVIEASKASTIEALQNLAPVLSALGKAGSALPKSLQVALTYPFVDEAVGRNPEVARNLHMGDFTNLSVNLSLDLFNLPNVPGLAPGLSLADLLGNCAKMPTAAACTTVRKLLSGTQLQSVCKLVAALCKGSLSNGGGGVANPGGGTSGGGTKTPTPPGGGLLGGLLGGILGRTATGAAYDPNSWSASTAYIPPGVDPDMTSLLVEANG